MTKAGGDSNSKYSIANFTQNVLLSLHMENKMNISLGDYFHLNSRTFMSVSLNKFC